MLRRLAGRCPPRGRIPLGAALRGIDAPTLRRFAGRCPPRGRTPLGAALRGIDVPMLPTTRESSDLVEGIGDDFSADGEHTHIQAMLVLTAVGLVGQALHTRHVLHALQNQIARLGVQGQVNTQGIGSTLAGVIIGRGTYATK